MRGAVYKPRAYSCREWANRDETRAETSLTMQGALRRVLYEWRQDFSNQPFFLTNSPGVLKHHQDTPTLGLVWWFGNKQGTW